MIVNMLRANLHFPTIKNSHENFTSKPDIDKFDLLIKRTFSAQKQFTYTLALQFTLRCKIETNKI